MLQQAIVRPRTVAAGARARCTSARDAQRPTTRRCIGPSRRASRRLSPDIEHRVERPLADLGGDHLREFARRRRRIPRHAHPPVRTDRSSALASWAAASVTVSAMVGSSGRPVPAGPSPGRPRPSTGNAIEDPVLLAEPIEQPRSRRAVSGVGKRVAGSGPGSREVGHRELAAQRTASKRRRVAPLAARRPRTSSPSGA